MKTVLCSLCLSLAIIDSLRAVTNETTVVVDATFQDRTYFSRLGPNVQIAFVDNGITTLAFRVYDSALLDTPYEKGALDGKASARPHVFPDAEVSNAYRENITLTIGTANTMTVEKWRVVPLYQTKEGYRLYYIADSFRETQGNKRLSFLVQQPVDK
jgi:hypothetical protein